jgi:hypothetical protein
VKSFRLTAKFVGPSAHVCLGSEGPLPALSLHGLVASSANPQLDPQMSINPESAVLGPPSIIEYLQIPCPPSIMEYLQILVPLLSSSIYTFSVCSSICSSLPPLCDECLQFFVPLLDSTCISLSLFCDRVSAAAMSRNLSHSAYLFYYKAFMAMDSFAITKHRMLYSSLSIKFCITTMRSEPKTGVILSI